MVAKTSRISKETWLATGLDLLKTEGPVALTIERLCKALDRSKGSFYFHFGAVDPFKVALLDYWEKQHTQAVEAYADQQADAAARRLAVPEVAARLDDGVERAIRVWAHSEPAARALIARVDSRRIDYVAQLIAEADALPFAAARDLASIEYAAFLGFQHLMPDASPEARRQMFLKALHLISPNLKRD